MLQTWIVGKSAVKLCFQKLFKVDVKQLHHENVLLF